LLTLAEELATHTMTVVFVYDGTRETAQELTELIPISQPVLFAPRKDRSLLKEYHVIGTPAYCLLDERHVVRATGFSPPDASSLIALLDNARPDLSSEELNAHNKSASDTINT
jgi:hypothetical protein